jgi:hypothetical protein
VSLRGSKTVSVVFVLQNPEDWDVQNNVDEKRSFEEGTRG